MKPIWIVSSLTGAWALCIAAGFILPRVARGPAHTGWDGIATFLGWAMGATALAVVGLIAVAVLYRRLGLWGRVVGCAPALLTAGTIAYLVLVIP